VLVAYNAVVTANSLVVDNRVEPVEFGMRSPALNADVVKCKPGCDSDGRTMEYSGGVMDITLVDSLRVISTWSTDSRRS